MQAQAPIAHLLLVWTGGAQKLVLILQLVADVLVALPLSQALHGPHSQPALFRVACRAHTLTKLPWAGILSTCAVKDAADASHGM